MRFKCLGLLVFWVSALVVTFFTPYMIGNFNIIKEGLWNLIG